MYGELVKEGRMVVKLIKFTLCLGNEALANDQKKSSSLQMGIN